MCGLAGFIDHRGATGHDLLKRMTDSVQHRGPDGSGYYFRDFPDFQIGLGHRRLSIIDLSTAADQPMEYDGLHIVFNGEVYNYVEIRERLISLGHEFRTKSDTEVILHAWREWGESSISRWRGMFSLAIFDEKSRRVHLVRDRSGVKPLYYFHKNGLFLFGSELKTLMSHPSFPRTIDNNSLALFLQYGNVPTPYSIFLDTYKVRPGSFICYDLDTGQTVNTVYWNIYEHYNAPKLNLSLSDCIKETEDILRRSFQYRMIADVPVGIFLSGGYDSTCLTSVLQRESTDKLKTFTIGSDDPSIDEAPFARQIASRLGTDHTEFYCTDKDARGVISELPFYYDEPFADSSAIPTILVSRLARKKVTVALSADGADEVFAGYNRYDYAARYAKALTLIPESFRKWLSRGMGRFSSESIPWLRDRPNFHSRYGKIQSMLLDPSIGGLMKNLNQIFSADDLPHILSGSFIIPDTNYEGIGFIDRDADPISYMMAVDYQTYLPDDILTKVDRASMSIGLEGREPFLDQEIVEWAAKLPIEYKYRNGQKKYILKQIVHRHIPESMMKRPKMGFAIPMKSWLLNELKPMVHELLSDTMLQRHGLFNIDRIKHMLKEFYAGRSEHHLAIWYLLSFQLWYQCWMTGQDNSSH